MRINPLDIHSARQVKAYNLAQRTMSHVDSVLSSTASLDGTAADQNAQKDGVFVQKQRIANPDQPTMPRFLREANLRNTSSGSEFHAHAVLGENNRSDAKISKLETSGQTVYQVSYLSPKPGPNTTRVTIDKSSGLMDVDGYYLGGLPAGLPSPGHPQSPRL